MLDRRRFIWTFLGSITAGSAMLGAQPSGGARRGDGRVGSFPGPPERIGCLYNGSILTVDPDRATAPDPADRNRLYVLHAVLIDTKTGRVAATYPALPGSAAPGDPVAIPADEIPALSTMEHPPAPGVTAPELVAYWHARGIDEELLAGIWIVDLQGAVVTPGLIDDHFHVSSWSKKLPDEGERFGFYADIGDPGYYTDVSDWGRVCVSQALWDIVRDANTHLADTGRDRIYLHGYWFSTASDQDDDGYPSSFLFRNTEAGSEPDPDYLLNRIAGNSGAIIDPPLDPCGSDPSSWPPMAGDPCPALLVHTSGQMCWYNASLLDAFNQAQNDLSGIFPETGVSAVSAPPEEGEPWEIAVGDRPADSPTVFEQQTPFPIDLVVIGSDGTPRHIPFAIDSFDSGTGILYGSPILPEVADRELGNELAPGASVIPFRRPIPREISEEAWRGAEEYWGEAATEERLAYGRWLPSNPYGTNWYDGAERGLIRYIFDRSAEVWRPSGYAEHYVMRDRLSAYVLDPLTPEEGMRQRRRLARWCHRHGITSVQDIMFYRRDFSPNEFTACEGLSFDHRFPGGDRYYREHGIDRHEETGGLGLRIGLYYYVENAAGIDEVLALAFPGAAPNDVERLRPPEGHPEFPGWIRWSGWKLQLDGGTGARTLFSSAPMAKPEIDDPFELETTEGGVITPLNHGFGLLTMTNAQEQIFSSRETAALYWLIRESDPTSEHHTAAIPRDWSFLAGGVAQWLDRNIDRTDLASDLEALRNVSLDEPDRLAEKIGSVHEQITSGWERTLMALARVWYESSTRSGSGSAIPSQVVCHAIGDGAVDLYVHAIDRIRTDLESFPNDPELLPEYWRAVLPETPDLAAVRRTFDGERYRVEHLLNVSGHLFEILHGPGGLDAETEPSDRNVVFSTQPALLVLDGEAIRRRAFPYPQELWDIPNAGNESLWLGVPARPRWHHHMPCPVFRDHDVPFCLSSDPPAVRDPRPAITLIGAVARTPVEIDPEHWVGQDTGGDPARPIDYLVGKVHAPFGLTPATPDNPMRLTVSEALCAMTFWAAYVAGVEGEVGAAASPASSGDPRGRFADLVIWAVNPLAVSGPDGMHLEDLATIPEGSDEERKIEMANAFITKFRPRMTLAGGVPFYVAG